MFSAEQERKLAEAMYEDDRPTQEALRAATRQLQVLDSAVLDDILVGVAYDGGVQLSWMSRGRKFILEVSASGKRLRAIRLVNEALRPVETQLNAKEIATLANWASDKAQTA